MVDWHPKQPRKVLLITEDRELSEWLASLVPSSSARFVIAQDKRAGLEALSREGRVDLVLLDAAGGGQRVLDFCGSSDSKGRRLPPVVLLAGDQDLGVVQRGHEFGVQDVITKPISRTMFPQRLRYLIESLTRLSLEGRLRQALEFEQFEVYYQPKVEVATETVLGVEALLRWHHPENGLVLPDDFIPAAEASGIIVPIGVWVLQEACRQAKEWQEAGLEPIPIAVNVSLEQLRRGDLVAVVANALSESNLEPRWLELEFTESAVMQDTEDNLVILRQLKELGVLLSIDDFGTGFSSLGYLQKLPMDVLKIDRSYVLELPDDEDAATIVTTIVRMARSLDLDVIAEGVESGEQLEFLRGLGCDQYQGVVFSAPVPAAEATLLLQAQDRATNGQLHRGPDGPGPRRNAG